MNTSLSFAFSHREYLSAVPAMSSSDDSASVSQKLLVALDIFKLSSQPILFLSLTASLVPHHSSVRAVNSCMLIRSNCAHSRAQPGCVHVYVSPSITPTMHEWTTVAGLDRTCAAAHLLCIFLQSGKRPWVFSSPSGDSPSGKRTRTMQLAVSRYLSQ